MKINPTGLRGSKTLGLTLIESMLAMGILSLAVLSVTYAVVAGQSHAHAGDNAIRATALAQDLLEEILTLPYHDPDGASAPGPETGETSRLAFDNVDDFHGYIEAPGGITDFTGNLYATDAQVFSRSVSVSSTPQAITAFAATINGITVTVTVADPAGQAWSVIRFVPENSP